MAKRILFYISVLGCIVLLQSTASAQLVFVDSAFSKIRLDTASKPIDTVFNESKVDIINTSAIDPSKYTKFQLSTGLQTNLAKGANALAVYYGVLYPDTARRNPLKLVDGETGSPYDVIFQGAQNGGLAGSYIIIDLKAIRSVNRVRLCTYAELNRIRSYTIFGGLDTVTMEKLFIEKEDTVYNKTLKYSEINFPTVSIQYLKLRIDDVTQAAMVLSEVQVFGPGFLPEGVLYSTVKTLPKVVNFNTISYVGSKPGMTNIYFSVRSGKSATVDSTWGAWSAEVPGDNNLFDVPEPRRYFQYKVRLTTDTLNTPSVEKVVINYDTALVVSDTKSLITPQEAVVLKESDFTLRTTLTFKSSDYGIDTVRFLTPSPIILKSVLFNGTAIEYRSNITFKDAMLIFPTTLKTSGNLDIVFRTTPFVDVKPHTMRVSSKKITYNPQRVDADTKDGVEGWSIVISGVPDKLLNGVKITKNPFTPNGDGKNDYTEFEFFLGNIAEPRSIIGTQIRNLSVRILDLTGRNIKTIYNAPTSAAAFKGEGNPMVWDGRDDSGKIVRPGLYLVQVVIDADSGAEQVTKTVVVAY